MRPAGEHEHATLTDPAENTNDWQEADGTAVAVEEPVEPDALDADGGDGDGGPDSPAAKRHWLRWVLIGVASAAVVVVVILLVASSGGKSPVGRPVATPSAAPSPGERVPFQFTLNGVTSTSYTGVSAPRSAKRAGELIRTLLSRFYDAGFADPQEWTDGPSGDAWAPFSKDAAARAKGSKQVGALTLGKVDGLQSLEVDRTRLYVRVLLDPAHRAVGAVATVTFAATGHLENGDLLGVTNSAQFLLRTIDGRWTIVGYPEASTTLRERPAPPPTPLPGPSGSASASVPVAQPSAS